MMMNTHKFLAHQFINNIEEDKLFIINDGHFIWGNLKPDSVSKYKFKKHYIDESFEMITNKIKLLSSMTLDDIYKRYSINKFNQELGVVCHFLCDYFYMPLPTQPYNQDTNHRMLETEGDQRSSRLSSTSHFTDKETMRSEVIWSE